MNFAIRLLLSLLFTLQMYIVMFLMGLIFLPWSIVSRVGAYTGVRAYSRWVRWTAAWMIGLKSEVRGPIPANEVIIASKHHSFFDIVILTSVVPRPKFIMKSSLVWAPVLGWFALRIGCVPVDRGKRSVAIQKMLKDVISGAAPAGQLIIYPQGTRVPIGLKAPYKVGAAILYHETGQDCIPVATNVGVFWPKKGLVKESGLAVVEFLPEIKNGLPQDEFLAKLEKIIEGRSEFLINEAQKNSEN